MVSTIEVVHALDTGLSEVCQAMALLRAAGHDPETMPVGAGDRALVELVTDIDDRPIEFTAACPTCGVVNEIAIEPSVLAPYEPRSRWLGVGRGVREPTFGDLVDLPADPVRAAIALGRRCAVGDVADSATADALDELDASLAGPIDLDCVGCGAPVAVDVDIHRMALERLRALAARAEREVHLLATEYAWDLSTIESLPDARRARLARLVEEQS